MFAVILAGGKGMRLRPLTEDMPKPMVLIGGKPILEHQLEVLCRYGIKDVYILTGYMGDVIENYFRHGKSYGVNITYLREKIPLGTAGPVKQLEGKIDKDFILLYGDIVFNVKLKDFIAFHESKKGAATLIVHPTDHLYDSDLIVTDDDSTINRILPKPHEDGYYRNISNAAIYLLSPVVFKYIISGVQSDFMRDVFPIMLQNSEKLFAYKTNEYIKDIGTFDRLKKVDSDFLTGRVKGSSKESPVPAIFIDRDGTLIKEIDFLHRTEDLELYDFSSSAVGKLNQSEYLCIIVTNQSVVARNLCNISTVQKIHNKLETLLGMDGVYYKNHNND
ncbi:MAG: sugar phosphate nucleotidyltransferase [Thermodesulfobacteriota bacterium]|nr:sugar phosphate nucleotidyltransferase [Thermodesulfobacteriota bacterium]